jgi:hypothetical protein
MEKLPIARTFAPCTFAHNRQSRTTAFLRSATGGEQD